MRRTNGTTNVVVRATAALWLIASAAWAQDLTVTAAFDGATWLKSDAAIALELSRALTAEDGRLAVTVGGTDRTELFGVSGSRLVYDGAKLPLPAGESQVVVHRVLADGSWQQQASFPLKVLTERGYEKAEVTPDLQVGVKAQLAEGHDPESAAPQRETYQDGVLSGGLTTEHRKGGTTVRGNVRIVGSTYQNEALRFATEQQDAPKVDLAGYLLSLERTNLRVSVGDVLCGGNRLLMDGFGSRGVTLGADLGPFVDVEVAAVSGSQIVGWDNTVGLADGDHRIVRVALAFDALATRPGQLRLEATLLDGAVLPLGGFNQGVVNDPEESRGLGLRLVAGDDAGRVRFEGAYARSRSTNPADPTLGPPDETVPVEAETRSARFGTATFGIVQGRTFGSGRTANLTLRLTHDRVDPLYRSVGAAGLGADVLRNTAAVDAAIGPLTVTLVHARSEDNLDDIPSILKTLTRQTSANVALPFAELFSARPRTAWMPLLTLSFDEVHQFGDHLPINGGFSDSHVPDQVSRNEALGLEWPSGPWTFAYRYNRSLQDNRQPGRERADLDNRVHAVALGYAGGGRVTLSVDLAEEDAVNREQDRTDRLRRLGINLGLELPRGFSLTGNVAGSWSRDDGHVSESNNLDYDVQAAWRFPLPRRGRLRPAGTLFLRFARHELDSIDRTFELDQQESSWQVTSGLTLTVF